MSGTVTILTDTQVWESITNISEWLQSHSHDCPLEKCKEVFDEDLAIGIPGECLFPDLTEENEEASREDEKGIIVYTDLNDEKFVWLKGSWFHLEKVLNGATSKSGWVMTGNLGERLLLLILTQLDYIATEAEAEVPYGCCPLQDPGYLLWKNGRPVGMCSIKTKGTSIWGGPDCYACDTLDTLYVRPSARRQGSCLALLVMLTSRLVPGDHLALSHPVSLSMCRVSLKFIQVYPTLRDFLWTLDEDGEVSGTVLLMLGSLMVRGALPSPAKPQPTSTTRSEDSFQYTKQPATPTPIQEKTQQLEEETCDVEDPRMSS